MDKFNDGNYEYLERVLGVLILPGSFYFLDNDIILKLATFDWFEYTLNTLELTSARWWDLETRFLVETGFLLTRSTLLTQQQGSRNFTYKDIRVFHDRCFTIIYWHRRLVIPTFQRFCSSQQVARHKLFPLVLLQAKVVGGFQG